MKNYYRIMAGKKSIYAQECFDKGFIGVDFNFNMDLSGKFEADWKAFNKKYISTYLTFNPEKSRIAAGLACGMIRSLCEYVQEGDIILCPDGKRKYMVGQIVGGYYYMPGEILPHRRKVEWRKDLLDRALTSDQLQNSAGAISTVIWMNTHGLEIEKLISADSIPKIITTDETIEDPTVFALEKHLEEFLTHNWSHTELGKDYIIYEDEGEKAGRQYPTDTGAIDILAIKKDKKELLVVELKRGRASDVVVGQVQRYMGYVKEELLEKDQVVKGVIIALEDDVRIRRALSVTNNIEFYTYKVSFKLEKK